MDAGNEDAASQTNLLDREARYVADVLRDIRSLVIASTSRPRNSTTTGDAAANGQRIEMLVGQMVSKLENLLSLSHQIRQLLVIGPLRKPGEGDAQAEANIKQHVQVLTTAMSGLIESSRQELLGPYGTYQQTVTGGPPMPTPGQQNTQAQAQAQRQPPLGEAQKPASGV